jgi:hypothetical protein
VITEIDNLRWITDAALAGGADPIRVQQISDQLTAHLLDRMDPRRLRTLELAERISRAHARGADIEALGQRFGRSRPSVHRLLRLSHDFARHKAGTLQASHLEKAQP